MSAATVSGGTAADSGTPMRAAPLRNIGVSTYAGSIASTRIRFGASSAESARATAESAPFEAQYAAPPAQPSRAETDETATAGLFTGESSAIVGAARWAVTPDSRVTKKGICVNHAQFDYYNIQHVYSQIGAAISIMNPSPVK